ncbi:hypothetical protein GOP47_0003926 [Adiantum capillus-veneris]|uniref:GDSL esterase/lipase n=1 Tax=Adiantum capillus-veneris TaxID=13818 RepID=A0A9D4V6W8_ADICA|nr:hypothetical protein GOP47_0003926 [Adiantum capillus-veneris]
MGNGGEAAAAAVAGNEEEQAVLYVFGDSYADTGNHDPYSPDADVAKPWWPPYGSTWPGSSTGRFSDGRVFTDFYVSETHAKEPIPYMALKTKEGDWLGGVGHGRSRGINFAFGGSGVFTVSNPYVYNVSMQIQQLQTTIDLGIVSTHELSESKALFVISGNDYSNYIAKFPNLTGLQDFIPQVVEQMVIDLETLSEIGFKSFVVNSLPPLGCVPSITSANNYSACVDTVNTACAYHNSLLEAQISSLQQRLVNTTFVTIDLFGAFEEVLEQVLQEVVEDGTLPLTPCCDGECGIVDENGIALYTLCSNPETTLYWDAAHPTNFGWKKVFSILFSSLQAT